MNPRPPPPHENFVATLLIIGGESVEEGRVLPKKYEFNDSPPCITSFILFPADMLSIKHQLQR